uniref:(northern house mosquito) hypothetical protein n=1 Tax=Culex pipiens TaxID=7175 RepID=A0A8D8GMV8_CULPI
MGLLGRRRNQAENAPKDVQKDPGPPPQGRQPRKGHHQRGRRRQQEALRPSGQRVALPVHERARLRGESEGAARQDVRAGDGARDAGRAGGGDQDGGRHRADEAGAAAAGRSGQELPRGRQAVQQGRAQVRGVSGDEGDAVKWGGGKALC